jgi:hypothetical protein
MTIEKWLSENKEWQEIQKRRKDEQEREKIQFRKRIINDLVEKKQRKSSQKAKNSKKKDYFLTKITEFKNWLNARTYLQGDKPKIETWISNLNRILEEQQKSNLIKDNNEKLIEKFRKIPPRFLDEKTRIAVIKKLQGKNLTSSNQYYLRKLKTQIQKKLKELINYQILRDILEI